MLSHNDGALKSIKLYLYSIKGEKNNLFTLYGQLDLQLSTSIEFHACNTSTWTPTSLPFMSGVALTFTWVQNDSSLSGKCSDKYRVPTSPAATPHSLYLTSVLLVLVYRSDDGSSNSYTLLWCYRLITVTSLFVCGALWTERVWHTSVERGVTAVGGHFRNTAVTSSCSLSSSTTTPRQSHISDVSEMI